MTSVSTCVGACGWIYLQMSLKFNGIKSNVIISPNNLLTVPSNFGTLSPPDIWRKRMLVTFKVLRTGQLLPICRRRTPSPTIISIIQIHWWLEFTFKPVQIVCSKLLSTSRTNFCQYATVEHHLLPLYQLFRFTLVLVQSGKVMGDGVYLTCVNCRQQPVVNFENQLMRMQVTFLCSGTFVSLLE